MINTKWRLTCHIFGIVIGSVICAECLGEEFNLGERVPSKEQVIEMLKPRDQANEAEGFKTRGIRLQPKAAAGSSKSAALSMEIRFPYNSAQLTAEAMRQLTPVAEGLASKELEGLQFVIEGHTDSKGSDAYNLQLSKRRAASVKAFLVSRYNIDPSRIQAVGRGEQALLDPTNPESAVNRRVRIVTQR